MRSVIIVLIISLILTEFALRAYNYFNPVFIFYDNSYNRFRAKPFSDDWGFKLNSLGFKDVEFSRQKNQNYRILGLGDSFAYGVVPYQNNYLTLIESQFKQQSTHVEVFNMGIPSTGPREYLSVLMHEGLQFHPDMVLLSFFIGNDFTYNSRKWYTYSYVASLFHYIVTLQRQYKGHIIHGGGRYCDDCPNLSEEAYLRLEKDRSFMYLSDDQAFEALLEKAIDYLGQIQDICNKNGIKLVVAIIPDEIQINPSLQMRVRKEMSVQEGFWNNTLPNERLAEKLKGMGVDYLDLYPYFLKESQVRQLYRPRDSHWNIAGNLFAANIIKDHILRYIKP